MKVKPKSSLKVQKLHNKSPDPAVEARLDNILQELYGFYSEEIDLSLDRVLRFLDKLGNPHLNLPPVVHVAGTNGKGSTIATLRSLLEEEGLRVHVMTSPHLVHPTERIRLAGELITSEYLIELFEECLAVNREEPITFFEIFTAATYLAFSRSPADICLLETGMGGRLDATNVVPNPICTVITTISKDHEEFLGNSLDKIAFEKAGIMKAGVPCIIGYQTNTSKEAGVLNVFHDVSSDLSPSSPLYIFGQDWRIEPKNEEMHYVSDTHDLHLNTPNLEGVHQIYNAGAALRTFEIIKEHLGLSNELSPETTNKALGTIHWPGRLQKISNRSPEIWIDGGHNDSAGAFLAKQAEAWKQDNKPLHLIIAMVNRKDPKAFLKPLAPYVKSITIMEIENEAASFDKETLTKQIQELGFSSIQSAETIEEALENIPSSDNSRVLITGSLYFLGNILAKTS